MANKMTKRDYFEELLALIPEENTALAEFVEHEIELLENRKNSKKQTANQKQNEVLKGVIMENLPEQGGVLISEFIKSVPALSEYTSQKMVQLFHQLAEEGKVVREVNKGRAYFRKA